MERTTIGNKLLARWASEGVRVNHGASAEALATFETRHRVVLPGDVRDYFKCVNGMYDSLTDEQLIRFWTLEEVKPLSEEAPAYSEPDYLTEAHRVFVFADYSIWALAFAIRLSAYTSHSQLVYRIGGSRPVLLAKTFSEFVDVYMAGASLEPPQILNGVNDGSDS